MPTTRRPDDPACGSARMMRELDATELGHVLICSEDHVLSAAGGLHLDRSTTCMQGDDRCDFRFSDDQ